jgi:hypothetical protein
VAVLLICRIGTAQVATARLEGVIEDPSGAAVPGAKVVVVNSRNSVRAAAFASAEGQFAFLSLQPSAYRLTVEAAGFRTAVISNLELNVGESVNQVVRLEVGDVSESVTIAANEARVQTADAQLARAITLRDIDVLPQVCACQSCWRCSTRACRSTLTIGHCRE